MPNLQQTPPCPICDNKILYYVSKSPIRMWEKAPDIMSVFFDINNYYYFCSQCDRFFLACVTEEDVMRLELHTEY